MVGSYAILCLSVILVALIVGLAWATRPPAAHDRLPSVARPAVRTSKSSKSWIVYLVVALLLSLWSGFAALFFLLIAVLTSQNPARDLSSVVSQNEKSTALRVYTWLFISSIFTVPLFVILIVDSYSDLDSGNTSVLIALAPLLLHLPLLLGLTSRSRFVYRHTQQGILLIAVRAAVAALALSMIESEAYGVLLFLFGNGSLWFFGSIWGWTQVKRGECWLMKRKGEPILQSSQEFDALSPQTLIERTREFINRYDATNAKKYALAAFRRGNPDVKLQAVKLLEALKEVETF